MLQSDKIFIKWDDFHQDTKDLCAKIKTTGIPFNKIVAISRGGLFPAGIAAYELGIRDCTVVNIATYVGAAHLKLDEVAHPETVGKVDEHTLIIDDVADQGQTVRVMRRTFPKGYYATIYAKPVGKSDVDIFGRELEDKWIVFPWDVDE